MRPSIAARQLPRGLSARLQQCRHHFQAVADEARGDLEVEHLPVRMVEQPGVGAGRRKASFCLLLSGSNVQFVAAALCGITIAATPATTQASPIQAVAVRDSPRKITLSATPIGTLKYACAVVATEPSVCTSRK